MIKLEDEKTRQLKKDKIVEAKRERDHNEHEEKHEERMIMMFMQVLTCTGTPLVHYRTMDPVVIIVIMHHIQLRTSQTVPRLVAAVRCLKIIHMIPLCEVVN